MSETAVISADLLPSRITRVKARTSVISTSEWDSLEFATFIDVYLSEPMSLEPPTSFWSPSDFIVQGVTELAESPAVPSVIGVGTEAEYISVLHSYGNLSLSPYVISLQNRAALLAAEPELLVWNPATGTQGAQTLAGPIQAGPGGKVFSASATVANLLTAAALPAIAVAPADHTAEIAQVEVLLGSALTAYIAGLATTDALRDWASGREQPGPSVRAKLEVALQIAKLIARQEDEGMAQAWFQGANPRLNRQSPARLLHRGDYDAETLLRAAKAYLAA